jgi:transposase
MPNQSGIKLSNNQKKILKKFMQKVKDKREYRAALGILLRGEGKAALFVAQKLSVTIKQVFVWCRKFKEDGITALQVKKQSGRPAKEGVKAKELIPKLLKQDPEAFGFLKGKWVLRDISRQLKKEGINLNYTGVRRVLTNLKIRQKKPILRAPGSIKKNYQKRAEIKRYKRIAAALLKKKLL